MRHLQTHAGWLPEQLSVPAGSSRAGRPPERAARAAAPSRGGQRGAGGAGGTRTSGVQPRLPLPAPPSERWAGTLGGRSAPGAAAGNSLFKCVNPRFPFGSLELRPPPIPSYWSFGFSFPSGLCHVASEQPS